MTASATHYKDVLLVPNSALRFSPLDAGASASTPAAKPSIGSSLIPRIPGTRTRRSAAAGASTAAARQVWVLPQDAKDGKGTPVAVSVTPGLSDGHMTEIVAGDLKAGMHVITDQKSATAK